MNVFDENDPLDHLLKVLVGNGIFAGLRGGKEQWGMKVSQVVSGSYPLGHEFHGLTWAGIDHRNRKSLKLRPSNVYFEEDASVNRQPVWDNDPTSDCWAGSLLRFKAKAGPNQDKLYCYPATPAIISVFCAQGFSSAKYNPSQPIGENSLNKMLKMAAKRLGFDKPEDITGHMLRRNVVTELVNDPHVNLAESMAVTGHKSVSAHLSYIEKDAVSEVERVKSLIPAYAMQKLEDRFAPLPFKPSPLAPLNGFLCKSNEPDSKPAAATSVAAKPAYVDESSRGSAAEPSLSSWSTPSAPAVTPPAFFSAPINPELRTLRNKCAALQKRRSIENREHRERNVKLEEEVSQLESKVLELESTIACLMEENERNKEELAFYTQRFLGPDA